MAATLYVVGLSVDVVCFGQKNLFGVLVLMFIVQDLPVSTQNSSGVFSMNSIVSLPCPALPYRHLIPNSMFTNSKCMKIYSIVLCYHNPKKTQQFHMLKNLCKNRHPCQKKKKKSVKTELYTIPVSRKIETNQLVQKNFCQIHTT